LSIEANRPNPQLSLNEVKRSFINQPLFKILQGEYICFFPKVG